MFLINLNNKEGNHMDKICFGISAFVIVSYLIIVRIQYKIYKTRQVKFSKNYRLQLTSDNGSQLYKNDNLIDKIEKQKNNYIIYYLKGEKGYYIFNILTRKNKLYTQDSIPGKEMQRINKHLNIS